MSIFLAVRLYLKGFLSAPYHLPLISEILGCLYSCLECVIDKVRPGALVRVCTWMLNGVSEKPGELQGPGAGERL